ncbi:hypothetical protein ACIF70_23095 [Actinacidiphila glaucinigra]|uniref:hypothetical protein n=1 Tax=Actinacidiphila glaucinigra TaxID=235986 RepID=UPI0037C8FE9E
MATLFSVPDGERGLPERPVVESWDAAGHPGRIGLRAFLDALVGLVGPTVNGREGDLALALTVGLDDKVPLTRGGHDLDNYLFPVVRALGPERFAAVFARKHHAPSSTIAIGPAVPVDSAADWQGEPQLSVRTEVSASSTAWKAAVHEACRAAGPALPPGVAVELHLRFEVSAQRNWSTLWKPAIDALGPLLGIPDPERPYRPHDDRIVRLALYRALDESLGHDIVIAAWWRAV